jgi:hypothetical protein
MTLSENAGNPAAFDERTHGNGTLDSANSFDKILVVDKDPKNQHTVKDQDDKLEETAASLSPWLGPDSNRLSKLDA